MIRLAAGSIAHHARNRQTDWRFMRQLGHDRFFHQLAMFGHAAGKRFDVAAQRQRDGSAFPGGGSRLLCAAGAGIACGEDARDAGLKLPLVTMKPRSSNSPGL